MKPIICTKTSLLSYLSDDKAQDYRLLGIFLREVDTKDDELLVVVQKDAEKKIYSYIHSNQKALPKISAIYYDAFMYQNEIYDFYGKPTEDTENYTLRLHLSPSNYFPKRKKGKAMIANKTPYLFTQVQGEGLTEVQVGPIHAGVIPPGHFRFIVDGEEVINLDTQMGWKHRGVESYFMQEKDLGKLLIAVQDIAGDSAVAYATTFARMLEEAHGLKISDEVKLQRIILIELERIYNHLWTMGALANDVGQAFILNGFLAVREQFLDMHQSLFGSRILKNTIALGGVTHPLSKTGQKIASQLLKKVRERVNNLIDLATKGHGNYDRFKDTGVVNPDTAHMHGALGVAARASTLVIDERLYDSYYSDLSLRVDIALGERGDALDRFMVRAKEYISCVDIILSCLAKLRHFPEASLVSKVKMNLKDGVYLATTEGHRGQILQLMAVAHGEIEYFKVKDPSFVNRNLIEYAVLNNIIADFPICNKSLDLSYSGFDI